MTTSSANAERRGDRRNRDSDVVEAAIGVFYAKGYAAATIQDVADVVGVLKGSLYHYISSKEDLLFRILQESHEQAHAVMVEVKALDVSPADRLRIYLERMHLWYFTHIERVHVYFNQQRHLTGDRRRAMREAAREFEQFLRDLLAEARGAGAIRVDLDLKLAAYFVLGSLNSVPRWYRPGGGYDPEVLAQTFTAMVLRGLT